MLVWLNLPHESPPLYDGVFVPPPPYRYVNPPAGQPHTNKRPTTGRVVMSARDIQSGGAFVNTNEPVAPQARLTFDPGALVLPPGTTQVILTIRPIPAPSTQPSGSLVGNVYRYTATSQTGASIPVKRGQVIRILLRGTGAPGAPTIEQYSGGHWRAWKTVHLLNTAYHLAQADSFGEYALVTPGTGGTTNGYLPVIVVGGVVVILVVAGMVVVRFARGSRPS